MFKKIILLFCLIICVSLSNIIFANDKEDFRFIIGSVEGLFYNDTVSSFSSEEMTVIVDDRNEKRLISLFTTDFLNNYFIAFSDDEIKLLRDAISKYKIWRETAIKNEIELQKEINEFEVDNIFWAMKDSTGYKMTNPSIALIFLSQNTNRHQLVIVAQNLKSDNDIDITQTLPKIYLDYEEVIKLENLLNEENINSTMEEKIKAKQKEDCLFN